MYKRIWILGLLLALSALLGACGADTGNVATPTATVIVEVMPTPEPTPTFVPGGILELYAQAEAMRNSDITAAQLQAFLDAQEGRVLPTQRGWVSDVHADSDPAQATVRLSPPGDPGTHRVGIPLKDEDVLIVNKGDVIEFDATIYRFYWDTVHGEWDLSLRDITYIVIK